MDPPVYLRNHPDVNVSTWSRRKRGFPHVNLWRFSTGPLDRNLWSEMIAVESTPTALYRHEESLRDSYWDKPVSPVEAWKGVCNNQNSECCWLSVTSIIMMTDVCTNSTTTKIIDGCSSATNTAQNVWWYDHCFTISVNQLSVERSWLSKKAVISCLLSFVSFTLILHGMRASMRCTVFVREWCRFSLWMFMCKMYKIIIMDYCPSW